MSEAALAMKINELERKLNALLQRTNDTLVHISPLWAGYTNDLGHSVPQDQYLREGMLAYADGTSAGWNPTGQGKGHYAYLDSAWKALVAANMAYSTLAGFLNRTDSTLSFDNSTRVVTVAPAVSSFSFWAGNKLWTKTTNQTVTIANTVGQHYIQFDNTGTLTTSTTPFDWTLDTVAPVLSIYWSGTAALPGEERHGYDRNRALHNYAHSTIGTRYESGLAGTFADTTMSIATGYIWDEDMKHTITGAVTTCRLLYRNASNQITFESAVDRAAKVAAGALQYDNAGTLTNVNVASYVSNWVYATNDISSPIYTVVGQAQHTTIAAARSASQPTFPNISIREYKLIYQVIYQNSGGTPTYIESIDFRTSSSLPGGGTTSLPASSVTFTASGSIASVNAQAAIEELDAEKAVLAHDHTGAGYALIPLSGMANLAASSIMGNNTGSPATPLALTAAQVKTLLAIAQADVSGLTTTDSPTFAAPIFTSFRATGSEQVKVWTYTYTVTAGDITAGRSNVTITSVTRSKVRMVAAVWCDGTTVIVAPATGFLTDCQINTATNFYTALGGSVSAGNTIGLTIAESV